MRASRTPLLALAALMIPRPVGATNVLIFVLDDLGADKVGSSAAEMYGDAVPTYLPPTPNIDALASAGLRFSTAYAHPVCSPTRASLLTGAYPFEHDVGTIVTVYTPELAPESRTLAEAVDDAGYTTGLFGKWHLGMWSPEGSDWTSVGEKADDAPPGLHGFGAFAGSLGGVVADYYDWTEVRWPVELSTGGVGSLVTQRDEWASDPPGVDAAAWIPEQPGAWLAVVSLNAPHADGDGAWGSWELDDLAPEDLQTCLDLDEDQACAQAEVYATLVQDADTRVGLLLGELADTDPALLSDTLVLLLGDNGTPAALLEPPWTPAGERADAGKHTAYESGLRVPFVLARACDWLDLRDGVQDGRIGGGERACAAASVQLVSPGLTIDLPVQVEDIFATILDLAGAVGDPPDASLSLTPCLVATAATHDDCGYVDGAARPIYGETFLRPFTEETAYGTAGPAILAVAGLRVGPHKLVASVAAADADPCVAYSFFDLAADPYETDDLRVGEGMTEAQQAAYDAAWRILRTDLAPDWLPPRQCAPDSPWDADGDLYESVVFGGADCDDAAAWIHPGAGDARYDRVDQDCDGNPETRPLHRGPLDAIRAAR